MPEFRPVRSSEVPEGTAMLSSTIVAHDFLDLLADAALMNVHVARLARPGAAETMAAPALRREPYWRKSMSRTRQVRISGCLRPSQVVYLAVLAAQRK